MLDRRGNSGDGRRPVCSESEPRDSVSFWEESGVGGIG